MIRRSTIALLICLLAAPAALADDRPNFGGDGQAWVEVLMGGSIYWDHAVNEDLSKDWQTPDGRRRFTQPGRAEERANENSVIEFYPCPGTQVYPGSNQPGN